MSYLKKNEDIPVTRGPGDGIVCKTCANQLPPVTIQGKEYERYTNSKCAVYDNKPPDILWENGKCEFYKKEKGS